MLCPEGAQFQNENSMKNEEDSCNKKSNIPNEGTGNLELKSYKTTKSWKKSITNFFRSQLRSTKSNDVGFFSIIIQYFYKFNWLNNIICRVIYLRGAKKNLKKKR